VNEGKPKNKNKNKNKQGKGKDKSKKCSHCNWIGHTVETCRNKDRTDRCSKCKKIGHEASKCKSSSEATQEKANNVNDSDSEFEDGFGFCVTDYAGTMRTTQHNTSEPPDIGLCNHTLEREEWVIDSGASSHYSNTTTGLSCLKRDGQNGVHTADNVRHPVANTGTHHKPYVGKVKHVPGLKTRLMSIGQLTDDPDTKVVFKGDCCFIHKDGHVVGRGTKGPDRLYRIYMDENESANNTDDHVHNDDEDDDGDKSDKDDDGDESDKDDDSDRDDDDDESDDDDDNDDNDYVQYRYEVDNNRTMKLHIHKAHGHVNDAALEALVQMGRLNIPKAVLKAKLDCTHCKTGKSAKHNRRKKLKTKIRSKATGELTYEATGSGASAPIKGGSI